MLWLLLAIPRQRVRCLPGSVQAMTSLMAKQSNSEKQIRSVGILFSLFSRWAKSPAHCFFPCCSSCAPMYTSVDSICQVCHLPVAPITRWCCLAWGCVLFGPHRLVSQWSVHYKGSSWVAWTKAKRTMWSGQRGCSMITKDSMLVTLASSKTLLLVRLSCHSMLRLAAEATQIYTG